MFHHVETQLQLQELQGALLILVFAESENAHIGFCVSLNVFRPPWRGTNVQISDTVHEANKKQQLRPTSGEG